MYCSKCGIQNSNGECFCKNCGNKLNDNEMFCSRGETKVENIFEQNSSNQTNINLVESNISNLNNNINQQGVNSSFVNNGNIQYQNLNIDYELKKAYIGKNAEKILNGHGGSIWLFLFGAPYLLYRKLYLYGILWLIINLLLNFLNLSFYAFIIQIILCFFFYKIYLNHVDKKIFSIKKNNPNLSFEELKKICKKEGGVSYGMIALSIGISLILGLINCGISSRKLVCKSNEGNITIMYNDKTITGYTADGISYDMDGQKKYAEKVGIDAYISEFSTWFSTNTTGSCK